VHTGTEAERTREKPTQVDHGTFLYDLFQQELDSLYAYSNNLQLRFQHRERIEAILRMLLQHASPPANVLDVGCGSGAFVVALSRRGFQVTGMDISLEGLVSLNQFLKGDGQEANLVVGDVQNIPFRNESFSNLICSEVLEEIPRTRIGFGELVRVLKTNGQACISMPNAFSLFWMVRRVGFMLRREENKHIRFPYVRINEMVGERLDILQTTSTYHVPILLIRFLWKKLPRSFVQGLHRVDLVLGSREPFKSFGATWIVDCSKPLHQEIELSQGSGTRLG
jgi:2-polyprenyl-3-methyl-5-hydroxy-6-metoxy-1,4-benzoquinol methylase